MSKLDNIIGKKFRKLTVVKEVETKGHNRNFLCKCDCGKEKIVYGYNLLNGNTSSCGCWQSDYKKTHNISKTRLNNIWQTMKQRCYYKKSISYKNYGARGITICDEWLNNPLIFYNWAINNGYKEGLTIDRINVDGNYEPNNCRWISQKQQCNNKRNCRYFEYKGKIKTIKEWSEFLNIKYQTLWTKLNKGKDILQIIESEE